MMHRWRQTFKGKNITYVIVNNNGSNTAHGIWELLIKSRGNPQLAEMILRSDYKH
jgi:hypothetical protein